jgi:hypothetical protein
MPLETLLARTAPRRGLRDLEIAGTWQGIVTNIEKTSHFGTVGEGGRGCRSIVAYAGGLERAVGAILVFGVYGSE